MARREATRTLTDDYGEAHKYFAVQLPAGKGWRLLVRLFSVAGAAAGRSFGALTPASLPKAVDQLGGFLDAGIDGEGVASAFEKLALQLLEGDDDLVADLMEGLARDGQKLSETMVFDEAFAGNYGELIGALKFSLEHNFAPFLRRGLGGSSSLVAKVKEKLTAASRPSPTPA